ncbi:MAG: Uma2 family endonuclease [Marinilabiliaceae bacterium]|nr:Uma2 family endonuclease [Marinilabiliaceae bacterium]
MEIALDLTKRYSYADYLTWADNKMRELIDGIVKIGAPAPGTDHQRVSINIGANLQGYIMKNKGKCKVFAAPFDVRLPINGEKSDNQIYNVVQPDICIICDNTKLDKRGCFGAPDFIAEIQSFSTARYDMTEKFNLYEAAGVPEYWIVYPKDEGIEVFLLQQNGKYDNGTKYDGGKIPVKALGGYEIDFKDIFY